MNGQSAGVSLLKRTIARSYLVHWRPLWVLLAGFS